MHELERIADREHEITEAVDERYARLRSAVTSPDSPFAGELQEELAGLLDPGPDHSDVPTLLRTELYGIPPSVYLRATPQDPEGELERSLLGLSDRFYGVLVDVLPDALRGFSPTAVSTMRGVHEINRLLVERGVLPAFTPVKTVPDPLAP
jgi:hypothetical protein